jgi:hypothetical protein
MADRDDELERARGDYEVERLARDVVGINGRGLAGALIGLVTGGPVGAIIGGTIGAVSGGAKAISDKNRRDSEWNDD